MKTGERIRITDLGPRDSYMREGDTYNLIGSTGKLLKIHADGFASPGYVTCIIELDKPILDYIVRVLFFEAKFERIEENERIIADESTEI